MSVVPDRQPFPPEAAAKGAPSRPTGYIAHKGVLDATNGYLYLATSDTGGPYDGSHGQVWRHATATGTWTEISPVSSSDNYYGYSGLAIDRQHPNTIVVTGYSSWWPDTMIWRSTDSGTHLPLRRRRRHLGTDQRRRAPVGRHRHRRDR